MRLSASLSTEEIAQLIRQAQSLIDGHNSDALNSEETVQEKQRRIFDNPPCIYCGGIAKKDGQQHGKQRYRCKACGRTFVDSSNSVMRGSHYDRMTWCSLIEDTFNGESLDHSATRLGMTHRTVFNMRHKILIAMEELEKADPIILSNIQEFDETYVLESEKGKKFGPNAKRPPRKRGQKASKRGLSDEQVCIMTGVGRKTTPAYAKSVNRASPSKSEIQEAFEGHIEEGTIVFTDGAKNYSVLQDAYDCVVHGMSVDEMKKSKVANLNNVNSFHSFMKSRYRKYRGVASKYINRYNMLFALGFRDREKTIDAICDKLLALNSSDISNNVDVIPDKDIWNR